MPDEKSKLVYSTEKSVPREKKPDEKAGIAVEHMPQKLNKLTVRLDRKGRGGKTVTIIEGLQMRQHEREMLLRQLKTKLGTGGTLRDTIIEIQGDHRDQLLSVLEKMGQRPKL